MAYALRTERIVKKQPTPVITIRAVKEESIKKHGKDSIEKQQQDIPLFYTRPIFKAKKHDPL